MCSLNGANMIDVHLIWLGSDVPDKYKKNIASYTEEYNVTLWTKPIKLINQDLFDRAKSYALKADIMRLELLMNFGGLYTDIDSRLISPLPIESDLVCMTSASGYIGNETIYSTKEHPAIVKAVEGLSEHVKNLPELVNIWDIAGATYITPIFEEYDHIKLPHSVVGKRKNKPSSIMHSYDGSWVNIDKKTKRFLSEWIICS